MFVSPFIVASCLFLPCIRVFYSFSLFFFFFRFHFQFLILLNLRILTTVSSLFRIPSFLGTSKRWYPFRPSRTESCRNCTDSFVPSKTKGRVCLPPCPEPLLFPRHLLSCLLVGLGQPKSSSGPGLTLTWITTELHTLVSFFIYAFSLTSSFFMLLALCITVYCISCPGIQQSSSFSGGEQSRLLLYCNPEHRTSLPAKRGTVSHSYTKTTHNLATISGLTHPLIFPQITVP